MLSKKKLKQLGEENREYLEALEEFDRTGQLHKIHSKERFNFTIDGLLMLQFRDYCEKNNFKMSTIVEQLIKEKIAENSFRKK